MMFAQTFQNYYSPMVCPIATGTPYVQTGFAVQGSQMNSYGYANEYTYQQEQYEQFAWNAQVEQIQKKQCVTIDVELSDCSDIEGDLGNIGIFEDFSYEVENFIVFGGVLDESINLLEVDAKAIYSGAVYQQIEDECYQTENSTQHGSINVSTEAFLQIENAFLINSKNNIACDSENCQFSLGTSALAENSRPITLFGGQGVQVCFADSVATSCEEIMLFDDEIAIICVNEAQMSAMACRANHNARVILAHPMKNIIIRRALSCVYDDLEVIVPFLISYESTLAPLFFVAE